MITCAECNTNYRPLTDAFKCPCCGASNWPDEEGDESPIQSMAPRVFSNCNVCGIRLRTEDEDQMGMCERCANE